MKLTYEEMKEPLLSRLHKFLCRNWLTNQYLYFIKLFLVKRQLIKYGEKRMKLTYEEMKELICGKDLSDAKVESLRFKRDKILKQSGRPTLLETLESLTIKEEEQERQLKRSEAICKMIELLVDKSTSPSL